MGLLGSIIATKVLTTAKNSTIRAVGDAAATVTATVISTVAKTATEKGDVAVKSGILLIKPTRSSEEYYGENALEIAKELLGTGFESITLKPVKELRERAVKKIRKYQINFNQRKDRVFRPKKSTGIFLHCDKVLRF